MLNGFLFKWPNASGLLILVFSFIKLRCDLCHVRRLLFVVVDQDTVREQFYTSHGDYLGISGVLLRESEGAICQFDLVLYFSFVNLADLFVGSLFYVLFGGLSVQMFLFVGRSFVTFKVPIIPGFAAI